MDWSMIGALAQIGGMLAVVVSLRFDWELSLSGYAVIVKPRRQAAFTV